MDRRDSYANAYFTLKSAPNNFVHLCWHCCWNC